MCPRCKSEEVLYWARHKAVIRGKSIPHSIEEPVMTAVVCNKCGYVIYNDKWGWAEDILEKIKQFTAMAKQHGVSSSSALYDFLIEMDIPSPYLQGGTYYIPGGTNENQQVFDAEE